MERKSVRVTIYNQPYTLAVSGDAQDVEELAQTVDSLMINIAQRAGNVDGIKIAVLACLQLADQVRGLERERAAVADRVEQHARTVDDLLDAALDG
jgi:cell division protein ZapA